MKILITGATGQLGLALQLALSSHDLLPLDHARLDITDSGGVRSAIIGARPDVVIHTAAWTDTSGCERDQARAMLVNATGARYVAEAAREVGAAMVHVSTNEVFDGAKGSAYEEDDATNAINAASPSR